MSAADIASATNIIDGIISSFAGLLTLIDIIRPASMSNNFGVSLKIRKIITLEFAPSGEIECRERMTLAGDMRWSRSDIGDRPLDSSMPHYGRKCRLRDDDGSDTFGK